ncbi:MAG: hypothetical protein ABI190_09215 [Casimicrobiaceae bacterium]
MTTEARAGMPDDAPNGTIDLRSSQTRLAAASQGVADSTRYPREWRCIAFLYARDGMAGTCEYCRRTAGIYRSAVLDSQKRGHLRPHFASLPEYRHRFIESYLDFKRFALAADRGRRDGERGNQ